MDGKSTPSEASGMDSIETTAATRTRTFTWDDSRVTAAHVGQRPGLEVLRAVQKGELPAPPMGRLMNIRLAEVERGRIVFEVTPEEYHYNPMGSAHGGLAATLLDSAMGCCVHSCLDAGDRYTTLDIKVTYLKALTTDNGPMRGIATLVSIGRTVALVEARMVDANDVIYAHATSTCLIKRKE
jgi:uncharacterized protein (TIGR00369 family)